ncbi:hypothetical protein KP79_PYT09314 [Mizuhopecten yessoensis]|uniref:Uncharacterized protein n=1 Tax=Mizuhopecten yessoensis TaxID=6573 RepID=A0A210QCC4_MIZYE|nr:hypothetical protein KP79_PYT09314 [Mizuhopecten yessoensis]
MTEAENCDANFDEVFKKFDEIQFSRRNIEDLSLHTIPTGSHEFQKVLWTCEDTEKQNKNEEEVTFRQRSHTIDSTYGKPKKHHVHFSSRLETKPVNMGSNESIDGTRHGILLRHNSNSFGRERSNTIDSVYKKEKFFTIPQNSRVHHSSSDSIEEEQTTGDKQSQSVQCSNRKTSVGDKKSSRSVGGRSPVSSSHRKTSSGESPLSRTNIGSPQRKHSQSSHRVH